MQTTKPVDRTDLADAISTGVNNASVTDQHGAGLDAGQRSEIADAILTELEARGYIVSEPSVSEKIDPAVIQRALIHAEVEALAWGAGERSVLTEFMGMEVWVNAGNGQSQPDRQRTLALVAEADAASARAAREMLLTLRAIAGLTPEGLDPMNIVRFQAAYGVTS